MEHKHFSASEKSRNMKCKGSTEGYEVVVSYSILPKASAKNDASVVECTFKNVSINSIMDVIYSARERFMI